ncbi:hypothetical protein P7K49_022671 [Saguinus oedipus]|uniref:Uncharacterized protein n=1 Tax=Saguinus oedipus TaxID=9490 RepID=A0ABQ9UJG9_SAGOE|nr:hypothetical protein P7K49_022671 [Saguinus oedipus]
MHGRRRLGGSGRSHCMLSAFTVLWWQIPETSDANFAIIALSGRGSLCREHPWPRYPVATTATLLHATTAMQSCSHAVSQPHCPTPLEPCSPAATLSHSHAAPRHYGHAVPQPCCPTAMLSHSHAAPCQYGHAVPQPRCPTPLRPRCPAAMLPRASTAMLSHSHAAPHHYGHAVPQPCCPTAMLFHSHAAPRPCCPTATLPHASTTMLSHSHAVPWPRRPCCPIATLPRASMAMLSHSHAVPQLCCPTAMLSHGLLSKTEHLLRPLTQVHTVLKVALTEDVNRSTLKPNNVASVTDKAHALPSFLCLSRTLRSPVGLTKLKSGHPLRSVRCAQEGLCKDLSDDSCASRHMPISRALSGQEGNTVLFHVSSQARAECYAGVTCHRQRPSTWQQSPAFPMPFGSGHDHDQLTDAQGGLPPRGP